MDDAELACYPVVGQFVGLVRKPRLLDSGNVVQFFIPADSPDADGTLALGMKKFFDAEVVVTVHMVKKPDGADAKLHDAQTEKKPYGDLASSLYARGFFKATKIQAAIAGTKDVPKPDPESSQSDWGAALAAELGYASMGYVPPVELLEWAQKRELDWLVPKAYRDFAGWDADES